MSINNKIAEELFNSVFGDPWHGPSVFKILEDVNEDLAFNRKLNSAHNIAELTLHLWAWAEEVLNRLKGNPPAEPLAGDWPDPQVYCADGWNAAKNKFFDSSKRLIEEIKNFPEEKFSEIVGGSRIAPLGTGISFEAMLHGIAQHNAYHAGQISFLKKLF